MTLVRIIEWQQRTGTSTRWADSCFKEAGCKVELSFDLFRTGGAPDMIFTPIPGLRSPPKDRHPPLLVTQLEGMGHDTMMPRSKASPKVEATLAYSDKIILADTNIYLGLKSAGVGSKLDDTLMVPNPAPPIDITLTDRASALEQQRFTVFYPSGAWDIKKPGRFVEAARIVGKQEPSIRFVMITGRGGAWKWPLNWLEADNIEFLPHQEHRRMIQLYAEADIVCPWSAAEILPWTVFESFVASRPTVVDVIGKTQSVHRDYVKEMCSDFGTPAKEFHKNWSDKYMTGEGDHFLHAGTSEELAKIILDLYKNEDRRTELSVNAHRWIGDFWTCKDKGKKVLEIAGL